MKIEIDKHIVIDSEICHGKPIFKGTRIMVWQILEMLEAGANEKEILEAFPSLPSIAIKAALHYAVGITRGTDNVVINVGA
ncbi:MAG: DUF433 domain-containing protein [Thermoplasmata archaeon]|nr:DUF433 domain-containing protein [Thermoplasmata archaeon]